MSAPFAAAAVAAALAAAASSSSASVAAASPASPASADDAARSSSTDGDAAPSATTSVAPPGDAPDAPPDDLADDATDHAYLEPGLALGVTRGAFYGAVQLDGGYHLGTTPLWLHGRFAQGALALVDDGTMTSDFTEARLGLETRGCLLDGIACLVGGVDFGYRHEMLTIHHDRQTTDVAVAIARLGLDLGGQHLRICPSIETGVEPGGWNGLGLTAGIAYSW